MYSVDRCSYAYYSLLCVNYPVKSNPLVNHKRSRLPRPDSISTIWENQEHKLKRKSTEQCYKAGDCGVLITCAKIATLKFEINKKVSNAIREGCCKIEAFFTARQP